jgi:hypothetical protein
LPHVSSQSDDGSALSSQQRAESVSQLQEGQTQTQRGGAGVESVSMTSRSDFKRPCPTSKTALQKCELETLKAWCAQLKLHPNGTGKRGKVLKVDYVDLLLEHSKLPPRSGGPPSRAAVGSGAAGAKDSRSRKRTMAEWNKDMEAETRKEQENYFDWWMGAMRAKKEEAKEGANNWRDRAVRQEAQQRCEEAYYDQFTKPLLLRLRQGPDAPPVTAAFDDDEALDALVAEMEHSTVTGGLQDKEDEGGASSDGDALFNKLLFF